MNFVEYLHQLKGVMPNFPDKYGEWLGYQIDTYDRDAGTVATRLNIREEHLSPSQAVHGGVISGFLDVTCGCAVFAVIERHQLCSTVDLNIKYFKPLRSGDVIIANAQVLHRGNTLSSVVANLYHNDDHNTPLAMAAGTFNIYSFGQ